MEARWASKSTWFVLALGALVLLGPGCARQETRTAAPVDSTGVADSLALARAERGRDAYLGSCAMCHGTWGEGDGPMAAQVATLGKAPAALNDPILLDKLGRDEVVRIITRGGARSHLSNLMPSWGEQLPAEVIGQIADYVMILPRLKSRVPAGTVEAYLAAPAGSAADGRKLFVFYCTMCHGPQGQGDGILADSLWAKHKVRPRDLTNRAYFEPKSDQEIYTTIALGGDYTAHSELMPGWGGKLSPAEVKDLVSYVRSTSKTAAKP